MPIEVHQVYSSVCQNPIEEVNRYEEWT
jgi:hypothetical protein